LPAGAAAAPENTAKVRSPIVNAARPLIPRHVLLPSPARLDELSVKILMQKPRREQLFLSLDPALTD
jgi:hypothetical protein